MEEQVEKIDKAFHYTITWPFLLNLFQTETALEDFSTLFTVEPDITHLCDGER